MWFPPFQGVPRDGVRGKQWVGFMAARSVGLALHIQGVELPEWRTALGAQEPVVFCGVITLFREALVSGGGICAAHK